MDPKSDNSMAVLKHCCKRYTFDKFLILPLVCIKVCYIFILPLFYAEMPQIWPMNKFVVKMLWKLIKSGCKSFPSLIEFES